MANSKHPDMKGIVLSNAEATFYDAKFDAEAARQAAPKATQAQARAADIAYHRAVVQAAGTQGHLGGPSRAALRDLTGAN